MPNMMVPLNQDPEIQEALTELEQAHMMFNNATSKYRIEEAVHRISAASSRIQAIIAERREVDAQKVAGAVQAQ